MRQRRKDRRRRCPWAETDALTMEYHDREWGVPVHDDRLLFEFLILDGVQAGLSWSLVLKKRENYRKAFDRFDAEKIARYSDRKVAHLLGDPGIVRNRLKVLAAVANARAFLAVRNEFGSFDSYIWRFTDGATVRNRWRRSSDIPTSTPASEAMGRDLKKRGFRFVGGTICYAYMQGVGMVNDHLAACFRHKQLA
ncbi:MAG: DNA-3-methyladenine glycosylase I [Gammaproteobacteria bacterium]|nr:DNA-3-methyladenine glycosylase I [Gammaproteobacteria bacterium]MDD9864234.1 DNA-3-methyladenine glycosylase I [Gammaproteobacteria bacterium]